MSHRLATRRPRLRVPRITAYFWIIKGLSTAMGESTSDYLVHTINPVVAVGLGFVALLLALALQFSRRRYMAWTYWFAVVMVGVFGTMCADVLHVAFGVPYVASSVFYALVLFAVFVGWQTCEGTLSIHSIDSPRREAFYWAAVIATFALGTAFGDMTAYTLHLGYLRSGLIFAGVIVIPAIGYWRFRLNPILAFWSAYVVTRPLGASFADWLGKPTSVSGLGLGAGRVSLGLTIVIFFLVAHLAISRKDVQRRRAIPVGNAQPDHARPDHARPDHA
ncbi:MAG: COG4705 family protein [Acidimicrobiales bacterium]